MFVLLWGRVVQAKEKEKVPQNPKSMVLRAAAHIDCPQTQTATVTLDPHMPFRDLITFPLLHRSLISSPIDPSLGTPTPAAGDPLIRRHFPPVCTHPQGMEYQARQAKTQLAQDSLQHFIADTASPSDYD